MTTPTLIDAARAALDALGNLIDAQNGPPLIDQADEWDCAMYEAHAAIDALRAAIAAAESAKRPRKDPEPEIAFLRRVADARQQIIDGMIAERCAKQDAEMPRPLADWHEDDGAVVWWRFLVDEPAWIGTPLDEDWPGDHTHWTPHPAAPKEPTA